MELKYKEGYNFNEKDFLILFMYCLNKQGINEFIDKDIVDKLYPYKFDDKYSELFSNIIPCRYTNELDLYDGITEIKAWRFVNWWSNNINKLYFNISEDWAKYIESIYSPEYVELMQQLVNEYIFRNKMEQKSKNKLNIYGIDPNKEYSIICGVYNGDYVNWQIITDGNLMKNDYFKHNPEDMIYSRDIINKDMLIGLTKVKSRHIQIENASFVIEQGEKGFKDEIANLYTKIIDPEKLELLVDFSSKSYSSVSEELMTDQKPYVYSLKNTNYIKNNNN